MLNTASKIKLARLLYRLLKLAGFHDEQLVTRSGVRYQLDLREGIDLSIFLFGGFQHHVTAVPPGADDAVIFDVGANIGAITLPFARRYPRAQVHCFEPTHYALGKLKLNLALNPTLAERVVVNPIFVGSTSGAVPETQAYASWRVDGAGGSAVHDTHLGSKMAAVAVQTSLDDYVKAHDIAKLHMLKIDTDGHELEVLKGARQIIATQRPRIVMEMCPYLLRERGLSLADYVDVLGSACRMRDLQSGKVLDEKFLARLPAGGGIDVLIEPH